MGYRTPFFCWFMRFPYQPACAECNINDETISWAHHLHPLLHVHQDFYYRPGLEALIDFCWPPPSPADLETLRSALLQRVQDVIQKHIVCISSLHRCIMTHFLPKHAPVVGVDRACNGYTQLRSGDSQKAGAVGCDALRLLLKAYPSSVASRRLFKHRNTCFLTNLPSIPMTRTSYRIRHTIQRFSRVRVSMPSSLVNPGIN